MKVFRTRLPGLKVISRPFHKDMRGAFSRLYSVTEFAAAGAPAGCAQVNHSVSDRAGTLRGLHFQYPPESEAKLISCIHGAILDIAVDLRRDSPTFLESFSIELRASGRVSVLVPIGCAHGFMTLEPGSQVVYIASAPHAPELEDGVRYDDPLLSLKWPMTPTILSAKDESWPPLADRLDAISSRLADARTR